MKMDMLAAPLAIALALMPMNTSGQEPVPGEFTSGVACWLYPSPVATKQSSRWGGSHPCSEGQSERVTLVTPRACATAASGSEIEFEWSGPSDRPYFGWTLFIYEGVEVVDDFPFRVYDDIRDARFKIPTDEALGAGEYVWYFVADMELDYLNSVDRRLTVVDSCPGDHNRDGDVDLMDLIAYHDVSSANSGKVVKPVASAGDRNFDGCVDMLDLLAFMADWSGNLGVACE